MSNDPWGELPDGFRVPDDLSALLDGDIGTTALPSQTGSVQVIAGIDPPPASPYITQVLPDDDTVIQLPYEQAVRYAMGVLAAAHRAHYFAAVLAQARDILGGRRAKPSGDVREIDENARYLVGQLLQDLPELDEAVTAPLRFAPVVLKNGEARVRVSLPPHTEVITGWTFAETCDHAHNVLAQAIVSQLDTAYRTVISVSFEVGEQRGRAAVSDLGNYFPHPDYGAALSAVRPKVPGPPPGARPAGRRGGSKKDRRRRG